MGDSVSRRAILAASASTTAALAGCADSGGGGGGGGGGDGDQALLYALRLTNATDQAHTVHVVVERDEEFVHWSTHRLGPQGGGGGNGGNGDAPPPRTTVERTWSDDQGEYTIHARLDGRSNWQTVDVADLGDGSGGCWGVELEATGDGEFSVWSSQNPEGCPTDEGGGENSS